MQSLLIDVRTAEEYNAEHLKGAINIPYQDITKLSSIYPDVSTQDTISLYCRSGRRSLIALDTLTAMGYINARDIGGFEDAKRILLAEEEGPQDRSITSHSRPGKVYDKKFLDQSSQKLLDDLRALEQPLISIHATGESYGTNEV